MGLKCRRPLDLGTLKQKMPEVIRVVIFSNDPNQKRPKMIPVPFQIDDPNRQGPGPAESAEPAMPEERLR